MGNVWHKNERFLQGKTVKGDCHAFKYKNCEAMDDKEPLQRCEE